MNYEELFAKIDEYKKIRPEEERLLAFDYGDARYYISANADFVRVFPGMEALNAFFWTRTEREDVMWDDSVIVQDCIFLAFADRDALDKEDYALIKSLGRSYRGKKQWPQMRRMRPYRVPWGLDEADCDVLGRALEVMQLAHRQEDVQGMFLVSETNAVEQIPYAEIVPAPMELPAVRLEDELLTARMKRLPAGDTNWDVTLQAFPFASQSEDGGAPFCALMLLAVDEKTDTVLHIGLENVTEADCTKILAQQLLLEGIKAGARPRKLRCANSKAYRVLGGLFESMGITAELQPHLPQLEEAFASLMNFTEQRAE